MSAPLPALPSLPTQPSACCGNCAMSAPSAASGMVDCKRDKTFDNHPVAASYPAGRGPCLHYQGTGHETL